MKNRIKSKMISVCQTRLVYFSKGEAEADNLLETHKSDKNNLIDSYKTCFYHASVLFGSEIRKVFLKNNFYIAYHILINFVLFLSECC